MITESVSTIYAVMDKAGWGDGPWMGEPDWIAWIDEETAYPCMIVRGPLGTLNGYVRVPDDHPCHGLALDVIDDDVDTHGGVTFAEGFQPGSQNPDYARMPGVFQGEKGWWIGFDTGHWNDVAPVHWQLPALVSVLSLGDIPDGSSTGTYRTVAFVRAKCANLARQLHEIGQATP